MFDTTVTVVGNVLNTPEFRRLKESEVVVAHFKVATTSRRYDRSSDRWVDGPSLRVRVNCWRRLAENVRFSVNVGDPVVVTGKLYSRDWEGEDHVRRVSYELDAIAVGHDLARGRARFARWKPSMATSAIDDDAAASRVAGEVAEPVVERNALTRERRYDEELGGFITAVEEYPSDAFDKDDPFAGDSLADLRDAELVDSFAGDDGSDHDSADPDEADDTDESDDDAGGAGDGPAPARKRRQRRVPVPA